MARAGPIRCALGALALGALALGAAGPVGADSPAALAAEIEARLAARDGAGAVAMARRLAETVGQAAGLGVGFVTLSEPGPAGYGRFEVRQGNVHAPGEPIVIYAEPFGFGHAEVAPGLWSIDLDVDLDVFTPQAERVVRLPGVMVLSQRSRRRALELGVQITYRLTAPPGAYVLWTTLRDRHGGGHTRFRVDVVVADDAQAPPDQTPEAKRP